MDKKESGLFKAIGWLGSILFALCAVPQAYLSFTTESAQGLSWAFLLMWLAGEILCLIYMIPKRVWPILFNYVINLLCLLVILYYKVLEAM